MRSSKAQDAPVEAPGSPREGEGADGMTLKRASRGNKHRNGRKTLGPKRENVLDPLGSLFTINKEKNQLLVSVTLSPREQHRQCCQGSSWRHMSSHSQHAEKPVLLRQTRERN